jgi:hypothetical protein
MRTDMSNLCVIAAAAQFGPHTAAQQQSLGPPAALHRRQRGCIFWLVYGAAIAWFAVFGYAGAASIR